MQDITLPVIKLERLKYKGITGCGIVCGGGGIYSVATQMNVRVLLTRFWFRARTSMLLLSIPMYSRRSGLSMKLNGDMPRTVWVFT